MPRRFLVAMAFAITVCLAGTPSFAQSSGGSSKASQTARSKMRNAEDPSSPEMQQAAAQQADCRKRAKTQKLSRAKRRTFMKSCIDSFDTQTGTDTRIDVHLLSPNAADLPTSSVKQPF